MSSAPTLPRRPARHWRWAGIVGGVLLAGLATLAACEWAGWPFLRAPLQRAMERTLQVPVHIDGADFRVRLLWQPGLRATELQIGPGAGLPLPHLLLARDVTLAWRWRDVVRWRGGAGLRVQHLQAGFVDARLQRLADGRASWHLGAPHEPTAPRAGGDVLAQLPQFGAFVVERGHVELDDAPLQTRLRIDIEGTDGPLAYLARIEGRYRALPLRLQVRSGSPLPLLDDGRHAPAVPMQVRGTAGDTTVGFDGQAAALLGPRRLQGQVTLRGPSLATPARLLGLALPSTPPFALGGRIMHAGGLWQLQVARAEIGRSRLAGAFDYDTRGTPPRLSGRLAGPSLVLTDLGPAVGTRGEAARPQAQRVLPQRRFDLPSLHGMDADVAISIDRLDFDTEAVAPLEPLRTRLVLAAGVLRLEELRVGQGANRVAGTMRLDARARPAHWEADLRFNIAELADWLPVLRRERAGGGSVPALTGALGGRLQVAGDGRSTAEILSSLRGRARVALRDGSVSHLLTEAAGLDLAQALGVMIRGDRPLPLQCARLDLAIDDGIVRPRTAIVENRDSRIRIEGQVNLATEALDLRATTKPKDVSPLSLRAPIRVTGTLADPVVGVDGGRLAGRALGALALGAAVAPLAALLPLIDVGRPPAQPCEADGTPGAAASAPGR